MPDNDPSPLADIDFAALEPSDYAKLVKTTPDGQLKEIMASDRRTEVLDAVFHRMPTLFRSDRAGGTTAVIHWNVSGRPDGGTDTYELVIADGACTLSPTPAAEPKVALTLGGLEFLKLSSGNANPVMMFMTGKLKAKGDLGLAANFANLFDMPKA